MESTKITFLLRPELEKELETVLVRCGINRTDIMNKSLEAGLAYITAKEPPAEPDQHLHFWRELYQTHRHSD